MNYSQRDLDEHIDKIPHVVTFSIYQGRALNRPEELDIYHRNMYPPIGEIEEQLNDALLYSSSGPSDGGIRRFEVDHFLTRLGNSGLYPALLVSEATMEPPGLPLGSYQVLSEIRLYSDPHCRFILPPYPEADPQGNYDPSRDIFLM